MIFVLGAARSGTSWLAKIFDSHPETLYRHEPDSIRRNDALPYLHEGPDGGAHAEATRRYGETLLRVRQLKAAGSLPQFPKSYLGAAAYQYRRAVILGLRGLESVPGLAPLSRRLAVPDRIDIARFPRARLVVKSVGSMGRVRLYADAFPESRIIVIVRHPCGHVSSVLKGRAAQLMPEEISMSGFAATAPARSRSLADETLSALPTIERLAWRWVFLNEIAMTHAEALGEDRVRVIRYEDLCADPVAITRQLFAFTELPWHRQTTTFLEASTTSDGDDRYFSVRRDPMIAAQKWQQDLNDDQKATVEAIVRHSPAGALFGY